MQNLHYQRNSGKKFFSAISAFVMSLCFIIPTTSMADYTEYGTSEEVSESVSIYDEYLSWKQIDERWSSTPMGYSNIGSSGCLLTSLAIMAVDSDSIDDTAMANMGITDIEQFNPSVLANAYTSVNGFTSGGAIASWGTIQQLIPQIEWGKDDYFADTEKTAVADEIRTMTEEGWYIIARVNTSYGGWHWVYIQGINDDDSIVMSDPANQNTDLYTVYPDGLQGEYWMLKGKNPSAHTDGNTTITVDTNIFTENPDTDVNFTENLNTDVNATEIQATPNEYFVQNDEPVNVYSEIDGGSVSATLSAGNVINISECAGNYGLVESNDFTGWVDVSFLTETEKVEQIKGDINNDGVVDKYDVALLNTYLQQKKLLPDGVSTLSAGELSAADINGDGNVDSGDVIVFIQTINNNY